MLGRATLMSREGWAVAGAGGEAPPKETPPSPAPSHTLGPGAGAGDMPCRSQAQR